MRLVLDTNVVVSGLLWDGAPGRLLRAGNLQSVELFVSIPLLAELVASLSKPKFGQRIAACGDSLEGLVHSYSKLASVVRAVPVPRLAPDPDDDVVIGTAIAANAELIVTGDRTLLAVGVFHGGRIVTVAEALQAISEAVPREDP